MTPLDLTKQTRPGCTTYIEVGNRDDRKRWITCGQIQIDSISQGTGLRRIGARLQGVTDVEHDSAWAFSFNVIGLQFEFSLFGGLLFSAYIAPYDSWDGEIRVPRTAEELVADLEKCRRCKGKDAHQVSDNYLPAVRPPEDFRDLYGKRIEIRIYLGPEGE